MKIAGIIPSRYGSTRFPGKPLVVIDGKTMIRRVYEQACLSKLLTDVIVATDDERIIAEVKSFGGKAVITSAHHLNGTSRCAEVVESSSGDVIINIQGDEPFIKPEQIDLLAGQFIGGDMPQIATLIKAHPLNEELQNPARVKVVVNKKMEALYFSRSIIPFIQGHPHFPIHGFGQKMEGQGQNNEIRQAALPVFYKHIGIYAYRKDVLKEIVKLQPSPLEQAESLEQLRWLENAYRIQCAVTEYDAMSIDTPEDLSAINRLSR